MPNKRLLTDEEMDKLFAELKLEGLADLKIKRHWWALPVVYTWELVREMMLLNIDTYRAIAKAQDTKTLKAVGEMLEAKLMLKSKVIISGKTLTEVLRKFVVVFKRGEMPK